jgi:hypothetical protein
MTLLIFVRAVEGAWRLHGDTVENGMLFFSGAAAERSARFLAERYAGVGRTTEVIVVQRDGLRRRIVAATDAAAGLRA